MAKLSSVCVYCGSRLGDDPAFEAAAIALGKEIAQRGLKLVYGGASIGMMGTIAKTAHEGGAHVTGIIPTFLTKLEPQYLGVSEKIETRTMHERKQTMFDKSDAFIVMPGGVGTLEETVEMLTWRQLSRHDKPIVLVNINNYWAPFIALLEHVVARDFSAPSLLDFFIVVDRVEDIVPAIEQTLTNGKKAEHLSEM